MARNVTLLRVCYWVGAVFDGLMIVPMLHPAVAASMFGIEDFNPGVDYQYAVIIGASLLLGWAALLIWADRKPVERKGVLLLTVCPVLIGLVLGGMHAVGSGFISAANMIPTWVMQALLIGVYAYVYRTAGEPA